MPTYKVTAPDGRTLRITGDKPPSAQRLDEIFAGLPPAANENPPPVAETPPPDRPISQVMGPGGRGSFGGTGNTVERGLAGIAGLVLPGMAANPIGAAKGLAMSTAGGSAGGFAGRALGQGLEAAGLPSGTSKVAGTIGGLLGSVVAPFGGPGMLLKLRGAGGGTGGTVASLLERALMKEGVAPEVSQRAAKRIAAQVAKKKALDGSGSVIKMKPTRTLAEASTKHVAASAQKGADKGFLDFVKREGPKFKPNEKVAFVKDAGGNPIQTFETPAKAAGWIRRAENKGKGYTTDFFQNLWSGGK